MKVTAFIAWMEEFDDKYRVFFETYDEETFMYNKLISLKQAAWLVKNIFEKEIDLRYWESVGTIHDHEEFVRWFPVSHFSRRRR